MLKTAALLFALTVSISANALADSPKPVNVPAGDLTVALELLEKQSGVEIVYRPELLKGLRTSGVKGTLSSAEAVTKLLRGTKLTLHSDRTGVLLISEAGAEGAASAPRETEPAAKRQDEATPRESLPVAQVGQTNAGPQVAGNDQKSEKKKDEGLSEIVVTGTLIRGVDPVGSPLRLYTRDDIDQSGAATIDQFARQMVENFSGVDTISNTFSNSGLARFSAAGANQFSGAAFDLHGIGPSATLTLLNGHRLASAGSDGSLTDISLIPLSAIDHIEVLTDGASAIYGADAVAGVVNVITRKDFEGAETSIRYGEATDHGAIERNASQLIGHSWSTGNAMLSYEFSGQGGLDASQRDYIGTQGGPYSLLPSNSRNSVFIAGSQNLGPDTTLSATAMYSDRRFSSDAYITGDFFTESVVTPGSVKQYAATFNLDQQLFGDWDITASGNFSRVNQGSLTLFGSGSPASTIGESFDANTKIYGADVLANGPLLSAPGGDVKVAVGASYRKEQFATDTLETDQGVNVFSNSITAQRHVWSVYGELYVPIIGQANAIPLVRRLELSVAARSDHYSDFGSSTNPKVGLLWQPVASVNVRGTWGRSFQAPLLSQISTPLTGNTQPVPDSTSPSGSTDTIVFGGGNPNLRPETSKSFTAGLDFKPATIPHLKLGATYFHIAFDNRIAAPPAVSPDYLNDPALAPFVIHNPSLSQVEAYFKTPGFIDYTMLGPGAVGAVFFGQPANIASTISSGVDVSGSYSFSTSLGDLTLAGAADRLLQNDFQGVAGVPALTLLNTFGEPTKWKGQGSIAWQRQGFTIVAITNVISSYENTTATPPQKVAAWITEDFNASYKTGVASGPYAFQNLTITLAIRNLANRQPPFVLIAASQPGQNPIPFDAANASPVGRALALQLVKHW